MMRQAHEGNLFDSVKRSSSSSYLEAYSLRITNLARVLNQIAEKGGAADAAVEAAPAGSPAAEAAETRQNNPDRM